MKTKKAITKLFDPYLQENKAVYIIPEKMLNKVINQILSTTMFKKEADKIYDLYPTKDFQTGRSLGKTLKNKNKIAIILRDDHTFETLKSIIERYVSNCKRSNTYMQNFGTFLNNLPDFKEEVKPEFFVEYMDEIIGAEGVDNEGFPTHSNFIVKKLLFSKYCLVK